MKILDSQKNVVASSSLRLNEEKQLVTDVALGEGPSFEVFPVGVSFQGVKEGLEVTVDIPNSGLEPFHVVLEYADSFAGRFAGELTYIFQGTESATWDDARCDARYVC